MKDQINAKATVIGDLNALLQKQTDQLNKSQRNITYKPYL